MKGLPKTINSELVFGGSDYRLNLEMIHSSLDIDVFIQAIETNAVAFHLFTSAGSTKIQSGSKFE